MEAAASLRASPLNAFFTVAVPLSAQGFLTAVVLTFAHTVGEFGVVLMVGGNIPGRTKVVSIAVLRARRDLALCRGARPFGGSGLALFAFCVLSIVYSFNRGFSVHVR